MIFRISPLINNFILKIGLLFPIITGFVYPQVSDISFDHIFLEQGLSQSIVKCIIQDRAGFMYFGTEDGLNIYNAYSFSVLRQTEDANSLSYNDITALCEDGGERIWIGTFNSGVNLLFPEEKKIIRFNHSPGDNNTLSNDNINSIANDAEGNIWVGTDRGLNRIEPNSSDKYSFIIKRGISITGGRTSLTNTRVLTILADSRGSLWIGTNIGLFRAVKVAGKEYYDLTHYENDPANKKSVSNNNVRAIYEDSRRDLWIGTGNGLNKITADGLAAQSPTFIRYVHSPSDPTSISHNDIYAICEDGSGLIWIGSNGGGLNIYNSKDNKFSPYQHDPLDVRSLSTNEIRSLYADRSGIMWIGTYGSGINKVSRGTDQFYHYKHRPNDPHSLSHPIVWSFCEDQDSVLWIGTHNGLNRLDRKTNRYRRYVHVQGRNNPGSNVVRAITPAYGGKLLLGTNGGGLDEFDPASGRFRNWSHDPSNPHSLIYNEIRSVLRDRDGMIWIGTYGRGMDRFDPTSGVFRHYFNNPDNPASLSQDYVRVIVEDAAGNLWIGTEGGGLNRFDKKEEKFTRYRSEPENPKSLSSDYIFSIFIDSEGYLWLGTYGGGLNKFNPKTGESKRYTTADGLPSESIYGMLMDNSGNFWISTNNGLCKFNPQKETFKNFNVKDGLQNNEFNGGSYYKTKVGEMFFGGINGFNSFYPKNIRDNHYVPPVVLTSFKKFNKETSFPKQLTSVTEIELSHSDNVFSFEFAALDYSAPEKNKYAYKMEGVDKDWVYVNADKRFAAYTTLSPGDYVFSVKGSNSDGIWNKESVKILINIIPPFWQRLWFISLAALLFIGIAFFLYVRRLRIMRMKVELQTAHAAQLSIMPHRDPVIDKLEISGVCIPANEVGGDFFDYFRSDNDGNKFGIFMGDVSGKAMKAAVTAIMTSGMIISETRSSNNISSILANVNNSIFDKIEKKMFVSVCICVIDTELKTLTIANAGMNKPIILSNGTVEFLQTEGPRYPLGILKDIRYTETSYNLKTNDLIILTTDGVNEAQNSDRELFGDERLKHLLLSLEKNKLSAAEIKHSIINEVEKFTRKERSNDDMTVLVIRVK